MDSLRKKLQKELQQQPDLQIKQSASWGLPVQLVKVPYSTIKRTTMDILMKMILLTIQKLDVTEPKTIADFLAVEPLFVKDLFEKMQRTKMIQQRKGIFELTKIGVEQLQSGVYEHPPEKNEKNFYYSLSHREIVCEEKENILTAKVPPFRLAKKQVHDVENLDRELLRIVLLSVETETSEGSLQMVVDKIETPIQLADKLIPCMEFLVYNRVEKVYFTRVWNTLTEQWDEVLEKYIEEMDPLTPQS
ncbi:hypothetical protein [Sporosarcina sp. FSL K6-3508]|uniref:hypothetical protein n=1 Tax=Sporosarcina sp. FSL K6-3508 TaxID=2921557 RepID=UPI003159C5B2